MEVFIINYHRPEPSHLIHLPDPPHWRQLTAIGVLK